MLATAPTARPTRRVSRALPYEFSRIKTTIAQSRAAAEEIGPPIIVGDPQDALLKAIRTRLRQLDSREPIVKPAPPSAEDVRAYEELIRQERQTSARLARAFSVFAHGQFMADIWQIWNKRSSDVERLDAAKRLAKNDLKPSKTLIALRIEPAIDRRMKRDRQEWVAADEESANPEMGSIRPGKFVTTAELKTAVNTAICVAVVEAVLAADRPVDRVFLPNPVPPAVTFTQTFSGEGIVPQEHLADAHLRLRLRTQVERFLEAEYEPEIADFQRRSDFSWDKITQAAAISGARWARRDEANARVFATQSIGLGVGFGSAERTCLLCGQGVLDHTTHVVAAEPPASKPSADVGDNAACNLPDTIRGQCGEPLRHFHVWDWRERKHSVSLSRGNRFPEHRPLVAHSRAYPRATGYVGTDRVSVEVIASRGLHALDALDAERGIRPQRKAKIDELRALATSEQKRLIEAVLATNYRHPDTDTPKWTSVARHLGKTDGAVTQLVRELKIRAGLAIEPPNWTRVRPVPVQLCRWCQLPASSSDHFATCAGSHRASSSAA